VRIGSPRFSRSVPASRRYHLQWETLCGSLHLVDIWVQSLAICGRAERWLHEDDLKISLLRLFLLYHSSEPVVVSLKSLAIRFLVKASGVDKVLPDTWSQSKKLPHDFYNILGSQCRSEVDCLVAPGHRY